ncbi:14220_t:CDS:1, partial [Entrophospora sp. SA101]
MSNKQITKRILFIDEDSNPKKNKTLEQSTSSIDFSAKVHNTPVHQMEIFEISDDESIGSDNTISSGDEQKSHNRETIDPEWFKLYPWLEVEVSNEKTILYCKICRDQNGNTNFAKGSSNLRLSGIKKHSNSNAHKKFELFEIG